MSSRKNLFFYSFVIFSLYVSLAYKIIDWYQENYSATDSFKYSVYLIQILMFSIICGNSNRLKNAVASCALIISIGLLYGVIHYYFGRILSNVDWKGVDGFLAVFFIQSVISLFICVSVNVVCSFLRKIMTFFK